VLIYLLDAGSPDIMEEFNFLKEEVKAFDPRLAEKNSLITINKVDLIEDIKGLADIKGQLEETGLPVYMVSAALNTSLAELILPVHKLVTEHKTGAPDEMGPEFVFRPRPVDQRD